tara:strand:+ start:3045 stop:3479 length:435 start_codon:yes stop_codon:yes gene_type:complete
MTLEFNITLDSSIDKLKKLILDYETYPNYLPDQIKQVRIIQRESDLTKTEETITFTSFFKKEIIQQSTHRKISENQFLTNIESGPAKNSEIKLILSPLDNGTKINIEIDLKLSLSTRFLLPIIKKWYKRIITGILYKMDAMTEV